MSEAPPVPVELVPADVLAVNAATAMRLIGVKRRKFLDLIYEGHLKVSRLPSKGGRGEYRIEVAELKDFLARNRQPAA